MRILVCGGRDYGSKIEGDLVLPDLEKIENVYSVLDQLKPTVIIEGGARGADSIARSWAIKNNINLITERADWEKHGKSAGPIRNSKMLKDYKPDMVLALPGGSGTNHMKKIAKEAGIEVKVIEE
jgi:hypothetical protein